jgi:hypothetical protein
MNVENLVLLDNLSKHYQIEITFFSNLNEMGLLHIIIIDNYKYIHVDQIQDLEKMIRMHHDLDLNIPGIEVAFNLLKKIDQLQSELISTKNRLRLYEN